ncbi:translation machinery-associated protein 16 [Ooceraea biroi]|nr:translation machinery-associated protein 16 [Ooceraea biroi]
MSAALQREIAKAKKILHPNSRKAIAIAKKTKKISEKQKAKICGSIKQNVIADKMIWMQQHMVSDVCPYTPELTAELLLKYIGRNDEELEQITLKHSIGRRNRQHASREDIIRMTKKREQEEFNTCGIEIPDILIATQCEMLRSWNGELRLLPNFKFRRFGKKHLREALQRKMKTESHT